MLRVNVHFKNGCTHSFLVPDTDAAKWKVDLAFKPGAESIAEYQGATMLNGAVGIAQKFDCQEILFMVAETDTGQQPQQQPAPQPGPVS